jgi:hypothetical protein
VSLCVILSATTTSAATSVGADSVFKRFQVIPSVFHQQPPAPLNDSENQQQQKLNHPSKTTLGSLGVGWGTQITNKRHLSARDPTKLAHFVRQTKMVDIEKQAHKVHRKPHSGRSAEKKQKQKKKNEEKNNPRAFAFASAGAAHKQGRRNMDLAEKKLHVPLVDRTPIEPPPIVVAVVGPPQVCFLFPIVRRSQASTWHTYPRSLF